MERPRVRQPGWSATDYTRREGRLIWRKGRMRQTRLGTGRAGSPRRFRPEPRLPLRYSRPAPFVKISRPSRLCLSPRSTRNAVLVDAPSRTSRNAPPGLLYPKRLLSRFLAQQTLGMSAALHVIQSKIDRQTSDDPRAQSRRRNGGSPARERRTSSRQGGLFASPCAPSRSACPRSCDPTRRTTRSPGSCNPRSTH